MRQPQYQVEKVTLQTEYVDDKPVLVIVYLYYYENVAHPKILHRRRVKVTYRNNPYFNYPKYACSMLTGRYGFYRLTPKTKIYQLDSPQRFAIPG